MKHLRTFENYDPKETYWLSPVGDVDDFGDTIEDIIIDGKTKEGPWALMTPKSFEENLPYAMVLYKGQGKVGCSTLSFRINQ